MGDRVGTDATSEVREVEKFSRKFRNGSQEELRYLPHALHILSVPHVAKCHHHRKAGTVLSVGVP